MTQSSCKRVTKSRSHPGMKLTPVRVFSRKPPPMCGPNISYKHPKTRPPVKPNKFPFQIQVLRARMLTVVTPIGLNGVNAASHVEWGESHVRGPAPIPNHKAMDSHVADLAGQTIQRCVIRNATVRQPLPRYTVYLIFL